MPSGRVSSLGVSMTPRRGSPCPQEPLGNQTLVHKWVFLKSRVWETRDAGLTFFSQVQSHFGDSNASYIATGITRTKYRLSRVMVPLARM